MNFDDMQKAWQSQDPGAKMTIDVDALLKEVRRNHQQFAATIFLRDVREVSVCALMMLFFLAWGLWWQWWSFYLLPFCCFFVGAFFLVDRRIQNRRQPLKSESLRACVENSLAQVDHQIWLLKNIFWWYLLPVLIGVGAVAATVVWHGRTAGMKTMMGLAAVYVVVYGLVY